MKRTAMERVALFFFVGSVVGFALASCGTKPGCTADAQCSSGKVCLPSGLCARTCATGADCQSTEKCSVAGGCVPSSGGCGVTADCSVGLVCEEGGTCGTGSGGKGGNGGTGGNAGTGGNTGTGGGSGGGNGGSGGGSEPGDGGECGESFTPTNAPANLMIVLDRSSSMDEATSDPQVTKWAAATNAITQMTTKSPSIDFGLLMFSRPQESCNSGIISVKIGPNKASEISTALTGAGPDGNGTPLAGGMGSASLDPALKDATHSNGIVVITDGNENCLGAPVLEVQSLFRRTVPIRTYVIGFGGQVDTRVLSNMAIQGGTARISTPRYYQAEKQADLDEALKNISNSALSCSFTLSRTGVDPAKIFVGINGQLVPRDPKHISGWDYDPKTNRVTLYGPACDALASSPNAQLKVNYGCAGDIDGGTLDAGEIG
jgi:hypothetical protein